MSAQADVAEPILIGVPVFRADVKSLLRSASSTLGREIMRGILGAIRKG